MVHQQAKKKGKGHLALMILNWKNLKLMSQLDYIVRKSDIFVLGWAIWSLKSFIMFIQLASLTQKHCVVLTTTKDNMNNNRFTDRRSLVEGDEGRV